MQHKTSYSKRVRGEKIKLRPEGKSRKEGYFGFGQFHSKITLLEGETLIQTSTRFSKKIFDKKKISA